MSREAQGEGQEQSLPDRRKSSYCPVIHAVINNQGYREYLLSPPLFPPTTFCVWLFLILKNETFSLNLTSSERTSLDHFILIPPPVFLPPPISLLFFFISHLTIYWYTPISLLESVDFSMELCGQNSNSCPHKICHLRAVSVPLCKLGQ